VLRLAGWHKSQRYTEDGREKERIDRIAYKQQKRKGGRNVDRPWLIEVSGLAG
jgi:hypothetical protein